MKKMTVLFLLLLVALTACDPIDVESQTNTSVNSAEIIGNQVIIFINDDGIGREDTLRMMVTAVEIWRQENPCFEIGDINYLTESHGTDVPTSVVFVITPVDC